jgi:sugar-phosphatase
MPAIRAVIFDMDGLLIDTEPIWRRVEIAVFGELGLHLTEEQCMQTMGVRVPEVVALWYSRHPWSGPSIDEVTRRIEDGVIQYVVREGEPNPGVHEALAAVRAADLPIAIASSSSVEMIQAVVDRLGIGPLIQVICSGEHEERGKPFPDVYLTTARQLGVPPSACLALEDSPNGVLAAKAAGMYCIVIPDRFLADDPRMEAADLRLTSLLNLTPELLEEIASSPARA